jgi:hypothetical protein
LLELRVYESFERGVSFANEQRYNVIVAKWAHEEGVVVMRHGAW